MTSGLRVLPSAWSPFASSLRLALCIASCEKDPLPGPTRAPRAHLNVSFLRSQGCHYLVPLPQEAEGSQGQGWAFIGCLTPTVAPDTSCHLMKIFLANEC